MFLNFEKFHKFENETNFHKNHTFSSIWSHKWLMALSHKWFMATSKTWYIQQSWYIKKKYKPKWTELSQKRAIPPSLSYLHNITNCIALIVEKYFAALLIIK